MFVWVRVGAGVGGPVGSWSKLNRSDVVVGEELAEEKYGDGEMVAPVVGETVLSSLKPRPLSGPGLVVGTEDWSVDGAAEVNPPEDKRPSVDDGEDVGIAVGPDGDGDRDGDRDGAGVDSCGLPVSP